MDVLALGLFVVGVLLLGFVAYSLVQGRRAPRVAGWDSLLARRVVLNLKSGRALDGLLIRRTGGLLFLRNAVVHEQGSEPAEIDGETVVELTGVDFIQAL